MVFVEMVSNWLLWDLVLPKVERKTSRTPNKQVEEKMSRMSEMERCHALCHLPSPLVWSRSLWTERVEPKSTESTTWSIWETGHSPAPAWASVPLWLLEDCWLWEKQEVALGRYFPGEQPAVAARGILPWLRAATFSRCAIRIFKTCDDTWLLIQEHWPLFPEIDK